MNEMIVMTENKEINLGSLNLFCNWLHKLHTIFEITNEQIIKRKKSLNVQKIKIDINIAAHLK